jgi:hypothetical protein
LIDQSEPAGLAAKKNVFASRQMRDEIKFLVDGADAQALRVLWVPDLDVLSVKNDLPRTLMIGSAQNFHERGFARAVLAEKDMNLTPPQIEINVVQSHDAGKGLPDMTHFQNGSVYHLDITFLN